MDKCLYCAKNQNILYYDEDGIIFCTDCKEEYNKENKNVCVVGILSQEYNREINNKIMDQLEPVLKRLAKE